jgi:c-di-GMP-binding flagellar brake protein YcgR
VTPTHFVVAAPHDHEAAPAAEMIVSWADGPTGGIELPTLVIESRDAPFPTWVVEPCGAPVKVQRRQFVRIMESDGTTALRLFTETGAVATEIGDLSEGGVRCTVPANCLPVVGDQLDGVLAVDGNEIAVRGVVVRIHPGSQANELALQFGDLNAHDADRVRRHVFSHQAHLRARAE